MSRSGRESPSRTFFVTFLFVLSTLDCCYWCITDCRSTRRPRISADNAMMHAMCLTYSKKLTRVLRSVQSVRTEVKWKPKRAVHFTSVALNSPLLSARCHIARGSILNEIIQRCRSLLRVCTVALPSVNLICCSSAPVVTAAAAAAAAGRAPM